MQLQYINRQKFIIFEKKIHFFKGHIQANTYTHSSRNILLLK